MRAPRSRIAALALLTGLGMFAAGVQAASMQLSSTRIELTPERPIASVQIRNDGDEPLGVQAEVVAWSQDGTGDVYTPTRDVLANPAIFRVPPKGVQVVRFGLPSPKPLSAEGSYRLFLQELPREGGAPGEIQTLLRLSVPIFLTLPDSHPQVDWQIITDTAGTAMVLRNQGTRHIQLTQLRLLDGQGKVLVDRELSAYVLPQQTQRLPVALPTMRAGQTVRVEVATDFDGGVAPATVEVRHADPAQR